MQPPDDDKPSKPIEFILLEGDEREFGEVMMRHVRALQERTFADALALSGVGLAMAPLGSAETSRNRQYEAGMAILPAHVRERVQDISRTTGLDPIEALRVVTEAWMNGGDTSGNIWSTNSFEDLQERVRAKAEELQRRGGGRVSQEAVNTRTGRHRFRPEQPRKRKKKRKKKR